MSLPDKRRGLQDRLTRIATRMAMKFGNNLYREGGSTGGIPVDVLVKRVGSKNIVLDNLGSEDASALSFSLIDDMTGLTSGENLIAQTYLPSAMPVGFYGSPTALVMLAKLKAGTDSVDIMVTGDSNTNSPGGQGYLLGLARGLIRGCCAPMYATPIFPNGICASVQIYPVGYRSGGASPRVNVDGLSTVISDIRLAPADVRSFFDMNGVDPGFGFDTGSPTGTYKTSAQWINPVVPGGTHQMNRTPGIAPYNPASIDHEATGLDTRKALTLRVVHSLLPANGASASQLVMYWGGLSSGPGYTGTTGVHPYIWGTPAGNPGQVGATSYPPSTGINNRGATFSAWSGLDGVTAKTVSKLTWPADPNRVGVTATFFISQPGVLFGDTTAPFRYHTKGPVAIYLESAHNNSKGWAVTPLIQLSGFTTQGVVNELYNMGRTYSSGSLRGGLMNSALKTILQEARERQVEAGGGGNIIIWLNTGINDVGYGESLAATDYPIQLQRMLKMYKTVWEDLGYPENDLAFMVSVTHPTLLNDTNQDSLRVVGKNFVTNKAVAPSLLDPSKTIDIYSNVTFIDINELGTGLLGTTHGGLSLGNASNGFKNFYQQVGALPGDFPAHLSASYPLGYTGGYAYVSELLMKRALRYTPPISPNPV